MDNNALRKKFFVELGVYIGLALLLAVTIILVGSDISRRVTQIQSATRDLRQRTTLLESLTTLKAQSARAQPYLSYLENLLPTQLQLVSFPKELQNAAQRQGVIITFSFKGETKSAEGEPGAVSFQMNVNGTLQNITKFLESVESGRFILAIDAVDISKSGNEFSAAIGGRVFSR